MYGASRRRDYRERIVAYMLKAMREAKVFTSWLNPERGARAGDDALRRGGARAGPTARSARTSCGCTPTCRRYGIYNSLAQLAIKICAPGRPRLLSGLRAVGLHARRSGQPAAGRLRAARRAARRARRRVRARRARRRGRPRARIARRSAQAVCDDDAAAGTAARSGTSSRSGDYNPVDVQGSRRDHVFAFARTAGDRRVIVAVPRLVATMALAGRRAADRRARLGRHAAPAACLASRAAVSQRDDGPMRAVRPETGAIRAGRRLRPTFRSRAGRAGSTTSDGLVADRRPGVHRLVRARPAVHAAHRLSGHGPAPARQRRVRPRAAVDVSGGDSPPQPRRDLHQRRAVLSGDARRHSGRRDVGQPRGLHLPARRRRRHARRGA